MADYDDIESDIAQTRDRLAATIDQLVDRTSPRQIAKREAATVKSFFVDPQGAPRTENFLKVAGGVAGFVALLVLIRKVAR